MLNRNAQDGSNGYQGNSVVIYFLQSKVAEAVTETKSKKCNTMHHIEKDTLHIDHINEEIK